MSRSGSLAGDSPPADIVLAVRPRGWVVRWARLLGVSISLCGLLANTSCQPTSDMVMRKEYDDYKSNQKTDQDKQNAEIARLRSDLNALREASGDADTKIQQGLDAEKTSRDTDLRRASERIDEVAQTIEETREDFTEKIKEYSKLEKREDDLEEQFGQLSKDLHGKVADVNTKVAEFSAEFSSDVATLRSEYQSLLIALKEHYQNLSIQLKRGQDGIKMQIEDFGELAQRMAEHSLSMAKEASNIMDAIEEQTREFRSELDKRAEPEEAEQRAPTERP